jgi:AraC-like DNA-binding protein
MAATINKIPKSNIRTTGHRFRFLPGSLLQRAPLSTGGLLMAGYETSPAPWRSQWEATAWHTLIVVKEGSLTCNIEDDNHTANAGEFLICPANIERQIILTSQTMKIVSLRVSDDTKWQHLTRSAPYNIPAPTAEIEQLIQLVLLLRDEELTDRPNSDTLCTHLSHALLTSLRRLTRPTAVSSPYIQKLADLWTAVRQEPAHPWDMPRLADKLHVSEPHLRRLCHQHYGSSPHKILLKIRMEIARDLLRFSDQPLDTIATHVGYASAYSFSRAFQAATGQRPGKYRKAPDIASAI